MTAGCGGRGELACVAKSRRRYGLGCKTSVGDKLRACAAQASGAIPQDDQGSLTAFGAAGYRTETGTIPAHKYDSSIAAASTAQHCCPLLIILLEVSIYARDDVRDCVIVRGRTFVG